MFGFIIVSKRNSVSVTPLVLEGKFGVGFKGEKMSKVLVVVVRVLSG